MPPPMAAFFHEFGFAVALSCWLGFSTFFLRLNHRFFLAVEAADGVGWLDTGR